MQQRILVIPEYNEARTIIGVLDQARPFVDRIIIVNDGSKDQSPQLIADWADNHPMVTLINHSVNQGMAGALLTGFAYVYLLVQRGDVDPDDLIINIDADGQHRPEEIPVACAALAAQRVDVLLGKRSLAGYPWFKHVGNWGLSLWASMLSGYRYHDVECGFRVMRASTLAPLLTYFLGRHYSCAQEIGIITAAVGLRIDNRFPAGIQYYRAGARVRDGVTNLVMGLGAALRVWFRRRRDPAQVALQALRQSDCELSAFEHLAQVG